MVPNKMKKLELLSLVAQLQKDVKSKENSLSQLKRGKEELKREVSFATEKAAKFDRYVEDIVKPFLDEVAEKVSQLDVSITGEVILPSIFKLVKLYNVFKLVYQIGKCAVRLVTATIKFLKPDEDEEVSS